MSVAKATTVEENIEHMFFIFTQEPFASRGGKNEQKLHEHRFSLGAKRSKTDEDERSMGQIELMRIRWHCRRRQLLTQNESKSWKRFSRSRISIDGEEYVR